MSGYVRNFTRTGSILFVGLTFLFGCNYKRDKTDMPSSVRATFADIRTYILEPKCVTCHSGSMAAQGINLSTYTNVMASRTVVPFKPEESPLYDSVASGRMPKGMMGSLGSKEKEILRLWILNGAKDSDTLSLPTPTPSPSPKPKPMPTFSWIVGTYFQDYKCSHCHSGNNPKTQLDLRTYQSLMGFEGEFLKAVEPGDPDFSSLFRVLEKNLMPPGDKKSTAEEINAVKNWILNGAKNE